MYKKFIMNFFVFSLIFLNNLYAVDMSKEQNHNIVLTKELNIILNTINVLEKEGYITKKNANEAKTKLVFNNKNIKNIKTSIIEKDLKKGDVKAESFFNLINLIKMTAILLLLYAFRGFIINFLYLFTKIPMFVYQSILFVFSLLLIFKAEIFWLEEAYYIKNFGVISLFFVIAWIFDTYERFFTKIFKILFQLNIKLEILISFYLTLYFGFFAILINSPLIGILAVISFVSMFSFTMVTTGIETFIGYKDEDFMSMSMVVNGIILLLYSYIYINNIHIQYLDVFKYGIEYVISISYIVALIIYSSFVYMEEKSFPFSVLLMFISFGLSVYFGMLYEIPVIPQIINTGFVLFVLSWIGYVLTKIGFIFASFVIGVLLYVFALYLENHSELFITSLF